MKKLGLVPIIAAALAVSTSYALAQNNAPRADTVESPANTTRQGHGSGMAPENAGSTGWTGGSGGETNDTLTTGASTRRGDGESAKDQPSMATGKDLKGPPTQFPANKTPE